MSAILLHLIGAVCLLLWGTRMVKLGFTRAYGTRLRSMIAASTGNRFTAMFAGMAATAALQSSTAMALILISFATKGLIGTAAALAVIIGADISTTIIAQILTFDLSWLSPVLLSIGIIAHMKYEHGGRKRHLARILIGLGLMLLSLTLIREIAAPLKNSETLPLILAPLNADPFIAIVFAAILGWMLHSSLATILLFASFAMNGIISLHLGFYLVLGANMGAAFIPYIITLKDTNIAKRVPLGNMIMRFCTVLVAVPFAGIALTYIGKITDDPGRALIHIHTGFNILLALIFIPLITPLAKLCDKILPEDTSKKDKSKPIFLDKNALDSPVIALAGAARETLRMAESVESMLKKTIKVLEYNDEALAKRIKKDDDVVDGLYKAIKIYMTTLSQEALDPKEADRYVQVLTFATNLEHVGDIIDKSLMDLAIKKAKKGEKFSKEGLNEIKSFHDQVLKNMRTAQTIFLSEDPELARQLVAEKKTVREAEIESSSHHFERLRAGNAETIATSSIHLDIIRDYRRINSYMASVAYAIIENAKEHEAKRTD